jgi:hypothetical protein
MKLPSFVVAVLVGVLGACGEVTDANKLPDAPAQQDGPVADADIDAPPTDAPPPRCDPAKPFGTAMLVPALTTSGTSSSDTSPWLTADELSVYFASNRAGGVGGFDIYVATRPDRMSAWGTPSIVAGVNTTGPEQRPTLSGDGLTMYAVIEPVGSPSTNPTIGIATRASTSGSFSALTAVPILNDADIDASPYVLADHGALYMVSRRGGANNIQIYRAPRTGGTFSAPVLVTGTMLDVFDNHSSVVPTPDELTLYFGSDRSGGLGGYDVWVASRASLAVGFSTPTAVTELNSATGDIPYWVSADTCVMYMTKQAMAPTGAPITRIARAEKPL